MFQLDCDESMGDNEGESIIPNHPVTHDLENLEMLVTSDNSENLSVARDNRNYSGATKRSDLNSNDNRREPGTVNFEQDVVKENSVPSSKFVRNNNTNSRVVGRDRRSRVAKESGGRLSEGRGMGYEERGMIPSAEQRDRRQGQMTSTIKPKPVSGFHIELKKSSFCLK